MSQVSADSSIYSEYDIDRIYDDPDSYGRRNSFYGDGKYPPDWDRRRDAVWSAQKYQCARCGIYKGDATGGAVHHIIHLADGGGNQLENLAGLCEDCHSLMHPNLGVVDGVSERAALFPDRDARDEVAVIRWPSDKELTADLEHLSETSDSDRNVAAVTRASVPTSALDAKRASSELQTMLVERGFVPRTSTHYLVTVEPVFDGLRGLVTRYKPAITVTHDGSAYEAAGWTGLSNPEKTVRFTGDATRVSFVFEDGEGNYVEQSIAPDNPDSEERISPTMSPPPLTVKTLPSYTFYAALFLARTVAVRGFLPALLFAFFAPGLMPFEGLFAGFLSLVLWFGTLLTVPTIYKAM